MYVCINLMEVHLIVVRIDWKPSDMLTTTLKLRHCHHLGFMWLYWTLRCVEEDLKLSIIFGKDQDQKQTNQQTNTGVPGKCRKIQKQPQKSERSSRLSRRHGCEWVQSNTYIRRRGRGGTVAVAVQHENQQLRLLLHLWNEIGRCFDIWTWRNCCSHAEEVH